MNGLVREIQTYHSSSDIWSCISSTGILSTREIPSLNSNRAVLIQSVFWNDDERQNVSAWAVSARLLQATRCRAVSIFLGNLLHESGVMTRVVSFPMCYTTKVAITILPCSCVPVVSSSEGELSHDALAASLWSGKEKT